MYDTSQSAEDNAKLREFAKTIHTCVFNKKYETENINYYVFWDRTYYSSLQPADFE